MHSGDLNTSGQPRHIVVHTTCDYYASPRCRADQLCARVYSYYANKTQMFQELINMYELFRPLRLA